MTARLGRIRGTTPAKRSAGAQPVQRLMVAFLLVAALSLLVSPLFVDRTARDAPSVVAGKISFANVDLDTAPARLSGDWRFTWASPRAGDGPPPGATGAMAVAGPWRNHPIAGAPTPATGLGYYDVDIGGLTPGKRYIVHLPTNCPSTHVWVDGQPVSTPGAVGPTAAATRTRWSAQTVGLLPVSTEPTHLRLAVAAFEHECTGVRVAPLIAGEAAMQSWIKTNTAQDFLFQATLLLLALYSVVVFIFRPSERASLYLGGCLLLFMPTSALLGLENLVLLAVPDMAFAPMLAILYLSGIVAVALFLAYTHALFAQESPRKIFWGFQLALFAFAGVMAVLFARGETRFASHVYPWLALSFVATLIYVIVVAARAAVQNRPGAGTFVVGSVVFAVAISLSIGIAGGAISGDSALASAVAPLGILFLLLTQVLLLAERWAIAIRSAEAMNEDLRQLIDVSSSISTEMRLDSLLTKIIAATTDFLNADRSSLFLFDPKRNLLWSLVAQGLGRREIQLAADEGVAGHSFTTGATVNVEDAYRDPHFKREVDEATGYRTKSILTMPIAARDGRKLGVIQALNRLDGHKFSEGDVDRMRAFGSQAAIAIDNATLFSEVVTARNYNESILGSMTNGLITVDEDGRLVKMNAAASAILEIEAEQVIGRHYNEVLMGDNGWFVSELDGVQRDGRARTFLDVDFRTGAGRTIDMNVQIVPLVTDSSTTGLLVLVEDIREEKRLEGAMRRFLTPKVVDQVLQRQDDILFGAACRASVLFADIRNFTTMAESLTPRATVDMLNEIFTDLVEAVSTHDGVLDKFMGDAVMAVFGAPLSSGRDPENAVASAISMMDMLQAINQRRRERDAPPLQLGIGIATGDVVAGTIGSTKRMDYTVIGDSVNLAARLQTLTKHYKVGIVVCESTALAAASVQLRLLDTIRVRGRGKPERIFQVLNYLSPATFPNMSEVLDAYARGIEQIAARDFAGAVSTLEAAARLNPQDGPTQIQLDRARRLSAAAPPADWDGVWETP